MRKKYVFAKVPETCSECSKEFLRKVSGQRQRQCSPECRKHFLNEREKRLFREDPEFRRRKLERNARWGEAQKQTIGGKKRVNGYARKCNLWKAYGMTEQDYAYLFEKQSGRCRLCNEQHEYGGLVVDHNHRNGHVRALLCPPCNLALGHIEKMDFFMLFLYVSRPVYPFRDRVKPGKREKSA